MSLLGEKCARCGKKRTKKEFAGVPTCDACHELLEKRLEAAQEEPRACPIDGDPMKKEVVSNVIIESEDPTTGDVVARSKFFVAEFRLDAMRYFAGDYRHELSKQADGYRIRLQRVDLVNVDGPYDYVLQYWI